jgi:hypothetical protein
VSAWQSGVPVVVHAGTVKKKAEEVVDALLACGILASITTAKRVYVVRVPSDPAEFTAALWCLRRARLYRPAWR